MVIVRVADEHVMDGWQLIDAQSWGRNAAKAAVGERATISEDGVGEDIASVDLDEKSGVAEPSQSNRLNGGLGDGRGNIQWVGARQVLDGWNGAGWSGGGRREFDCACDGGFAPGLLQS